MPALAADHQDGAAVLTDPSTDINDVFAWTSPDGTKLNLVMDVFPAATSAARFSNVAQYVFHTTSSAGYGMANAASEDVLCTFDTAQTVSCWGGGEYLHGDASNPAGISSASGKLRVFAGARRREAFDLALTAALRARDAPARCDLGRRADRLASRPPPRLQALVSEGLAACGGDAESATELSAGR